MAVLINKALLEIPPKFSGMPPVNPEWQEKSDHEKSLRQWKGAEGLAEDVRYYGQWIRDEGFSQLKELYPKVETNEEEGSTEATILAWLWARTVASPNPSLSGAHVPLISNYWLSKKKGKEVWVSPILDRNKKKWSFQVCKGKPEDRTFVNTGTKITGGRGDYRCIFSGDPITAEYIRQEGQEGRIRERLVAIVAKGPSGKCFLSPSKDQEDLASLSIPEDVPETNLPERALGFRVQNYGMRKHRDLFTNRQLVALNTLASLVSSAHELILHHISEANVPEHRESDSDYAKGIAIWLSLAVSKMVDYHASLIGWYSVESRTSHLFTGNALQMLLDFVENNPFCNVGGSFEKNIDIQHRALIALQLATIGKPGLVSQKSAMESDKSSDAVRVLSTDPPYYDNVPYGDLSDLFYIWLRRALNFLRLPELGTLLVPKVEELIADPHRHETSELAETFFLTNMSSALQQMHNNLHPDCPSTIYYAFKQTERTGEAATGWATFLQAIVAGGLVVSGTWPMWTERSGRKRSHDSNALATSIVLVCRKRPENAPTIDRATFRRLLSRELPSALKHLQQGNIAPVDMAQASIGPGMSIFSRHAKVIEADGTAMPVRTALQIINQALDEYLAEQTGEFGPDTRFAITWFETHGYDQGPFGEAETLAKARNVAVQGVVEAGVLHSAAGRVRLLKRSELPEDWEPETDTRLTVWECTQHLIRHLEEKGEEAAADLLSRLGERVEPARDLAYQLYQTCERKGWAEEARAYNGLVVAWPELARLAAQKGVASPVQGELF